MGAHAMVELDADSRGGTETAKDGALNPALMISQPALVDRGRSENMSQVRDILGRRRRVHHIPALSTRCVGAFACAGTWKPLHVVGNRHP